MTVKSLNNAGSLIKPPESQKIKSGLVVLQKGQEIGEHTTDGKEEAIVVLQGRALVEIEGELPQTVEAGNLVFIPENKKHNLKNESDEILKYVYVVALLF